VNQDGGNTRDCAVAGGYQGVRVLLVCGVCLIRYDAYEIKKVTCLMTTHELNGTEMLYKQTKITSI